MSMIKVKYTGKDELFTEYNGTKYSFSKKYHTKIIPVEVYRYLQDPKNNPFLDELIPVTGAEEEKKEDVKKTIEDEVDNIEEELKEFKKESKQETNRYESKKSGSSRKSFRPNKNIA